MKPIKKSTAKILIIIVSVLLAIGAIFAFVPIKFSTVKYMSFIGNIRYSNELKGGMYAEYTIDGSATKSELSKTVTELRSILSEEGFYNAYVASINGDKIRVELSGNPQKDFAATSSVLSGLDVGEFALSTSNDVTKAFIRGREHIKEVKLGSSAGSTYVQVVFNEAGLNSYLANMSSSATIYVYMGGDLQTSFSGSAPSSNDMYLTFEDYNEAQDFATKVKLGCFVPVDFITDETVINTMSSPYSTVGLTADINSKAYGKSNLFVAIIVALSVIVCAALVYMIMVHKAFGIVQAIAFVADLIVVTFLLQGLSWVEIGLSGAYVIAFGLALIFYGSFIFIDKVTDEFNEGKTISAALESGYKKSVGINASISILVFVFGFLCAIFSSGALLSAGVIACIFAAVAALNNLVLCPWFVNIYRAYNSTKAEYYGLVKGGKTNED